jgi:hypothetical protein
MSIWELNLRTKQHNLTSVLGIFPRSIANMTREKGGGYERILLDSILMCISYLTVSQKVLPSMATTRGRGGWVRAGYWIAS